MIIAGTLLRTVQEQIEAGDDRPIDPDKLNFDEDKKYIVTVNFNTKFPPIGFATVRKGDDGRLYAEAEIFDDVGLKEGYFKFAVGVVGLITDMSDVKLVDLAVVKENSDRGILPFAIIT